jgi:hypothetical protein
MDSGAVSDSPEESPAAMEGAATTADASDGGMAETGTDGSSSDATVAPDAADAATDASPRLPEAGVGCIPSGDQSMLSAAAEGLPSSGLVLWLRADRGVYILQTDAGSASSSDAGTPGVCAWLDQSGQGWLLGNGGSAPAVWLDSGVGGQAAIHFNSGADPLQTSGVLNIGPTSPRTFVAVEELVNTDGRFAPIEQGHAGTPGTYLAIDSNTWQTAGNREGVYVTSNSYDSDLATASGTPRVHILAISTMTVGSPVLAAVDYRVNGVARTLTAAAANGGNDLQDFSGANFTQVGGTQFQTTTGVSTDALLAEVLVYNRAVDASEKQNIESALKARYSIP